MSTWPKISEIAKKVQGGELKAIDLVRQSLEAIEDKNEYNAIISTLEERAQERAAEIDKRIASGEKVGKLAGVPFIAKDNFLTFGGKTTAASNILRTFEAPYQATAIEKLEKTVIGLLLSIRATGPEFPVGVPAAQQLRLYWGWRHLLLEQTRAAQLVSQPVLRGVWVLNPPMV
jgi:Asp-tRNA(Asn)/Glu-tRNA(Gln) amidotransferase A subunit family amidase